MNSRERVLRTLHFEPTDRAPFDLMEGCVWKELLDYFHKTHGFTDPNQVIEYLDPDFRWTFLKYQPLEDSALSDSQSTSEAIPEYQVHSKLVSKGPLAGAHRLEELEHYPFPDPRVLVPADYAAVRRQYPEKAIVFCPGWIPLFWTVCEAFGMEEAMLRMMDNPGLPRNDGTVVDDDLFDAFIQRYHQFCMDILTRGARAARGHCDLALLGDDFASQQGMMISPELWRRRIKPYLAEQVRLLRENDLLVLFHSCGSVRPILNDLIEIGVNALLVFQTTARGMDAASIAHDFGGRLAFYGGIDVQQLLSFGTPQQVEAEVRANLNAFAPYGGYIVANSHHTIASIKGENIEAMCRAARKFN